MGWKLFNSIQPGIGAELKATLRRLRPWMLAVTDFGEMLPRPENRVMLHPTRKDQWGIPIVQIGCSLGESDKKVIAAGYEDANKVIEAAGASVSYQNKHYGGVGLGHPRDEHRSYGRCSEQVGERTAIKLPAPLIDELKRWRPRYPKNEHDCARDPETRDPE